MREDPRAQTPPAASKRVLPRDGRRPHTPGRLRHRRGPQNSVARQPQSDRGGRVRHGSESPTGMHRRVVRSSSRSRSSRSPPGVAAELAAERPSSSTVERLPGCVTLLYSEAGDQLPVLDSNRSSDRCGCRNLDSRCSRDLGRLHSRSLGWITAHPSAIRSRG